MFMSDSGKKFTKRSATYPGISLDHAIYLARILNEVFGSAAFSREDAARAIGYSSLSGPAARKLAALIQFGLLERHMRGIYKLSALSDRVLFPKSEEERREAVYEAVRHPMIFSLLLANPSGQSLPTFLESILVKNFGVSREVAPKIAKTFKRSAAFAGVLEDGGLSSRPPESVNKKNTERDERTEGTRRIGSKDASNMEVFPLTGGVKLSIPRREDLADVVTSQEFRNVIQALKALAQRYFTETENDSSDRSTG